MDRQYRLTAHAVLLYFQDCFARYVTRYRLAAFDLVKQQKMWVITEYYAQMTDADAFWSEEIDVELWVSELTPLRLYSDFRITHASSGETIATGSSCWNLLNTTTKRLESMTFLSDVLPVEPILMVESHKKRRFPAGQTLIAGTDHKVTGLDLDFNGHVNNRSYLTIALLTTPTELSSTHKLFEIGIQWLRESYSEDTIRCDMHSAASSDDAYSYVYTLRNAKGQDVAKILTQWHLIANHRDIAEVLDRKL